MIALEMVHYFEYYNVYLSFISKYFFTPVYVHQNALLQYLHLNSIGQAKSAKRSTFSQKMDQKWGFC